jgi:hypothetical protein
MSALQKYQNEKICLTADGKWLHGNTEITHERTLDLFFKSIECKNGRYFLIGEKKPVPIDVEDTAFFVRGLNRPSKSNYEITLSDGSRETLEPHTLDVGPENRLYCRVKDGSVKALFDRKVYYELMKDLTEESGFYGLKREGLFYPIQRKEDHGAKKPTEKKLIPKAKPVKTVKKNAKVKSRSKPAKSKPIKKAAKKSVSKSIKKSPKKK